MVKILFILVTFMVSDMVLAKIFLTAAALGKIKEPEY
jgi:hypothetical protein